MFLPLLLALTDAPAPTYPASDVFLRQRDVITRMNEMFPQVEVDVRWEPCEMENSFYRPWDKTIVLCTELEAHPDAAVGIAAHEMAHAIEMQITDVSEEQDADELAALCLIHLDLRQELLATGLYMAAIGGGHEPGDPHPGMEFRAWEMMCIEDGSEDHPASLECQALYLGLVTRYEHRLANP